MDGYNAQVAESIKLLFELTSRIDERVKYLSENASKQDGKFETIAEYQQKLLERIIALENKNGETIKKQTEDLNIRIRNIELQIKTLEVISKGNSNRWDKITDMIWRIIIIMTASFLIWKMGIGN
jgi:hypothetical protein